MGDRQKFLAETEFCHGKTKEFLCARVLVENEEHGTLTKYLTQESVQEAIFDNINWKRFFLVEATPACNGPLHKLFNYDAVTITAQQILEGTYNYPKDFDQATKEICQECARIIEPKKVGIKLNE
jgi:hypothetical protein